MNFTGSQLLDRISLLRHTLTAIGPVRIPREGRPMPVAEAPQRIEDKTIQPIPPNERHGRTRDLFSLWFGSNIMLLTVVTGALATSVYGLPFWLAVIAIVVGNLVGAVFMALHSAQGPRLGVPQMMQTRGQFGSYGSLIVIVVVVVMYVGFFASNLVLAGQSLNVLTSGISVDAGILDRRRGQRGRDDLRLRPDPRLRPGDDLPGGRGPAADLHLDRRGARARARLRLVRPLHRRRVHRHGDRRRALADRLRALRLGLLPLHACRHRRASRRSGPATGAARSARSCR